MKLLKQIKEFNESIDLSKKHPNYFNKKLLRSAFILCLILIIFAMYLNNWSYQYVYIECKEDFCINPLYYCENDLNSCMKGSLCNNYDCSKVILSKGDKIGKYNFFIENNTFICLLIIILAFIINHLLYKRKYGKNNRN